MFIGPVVIFFLDLKVKILGLVLQSGTIGVVLPHDFCTRIDNIDSVCSYILFDNPLVIMIGFEILIGFTFLISFIGLLGLDPWVRPLLPQGPILTLV